VLSSDDPEPDILAGERLQPEDGWLGLANKMKQACVNRGFDAIKIEICQLKALWLKRAFDNRRTGYIRIGNSCVDASRMKYLGTLKTRDGLL